MLINPDALFKAPIEPHITLLPWLNYTKALTDKLREKAGDAELHVLQQQWQRPKWWDRYTLKLTSERIYQREIAMQAHNKLCWYARTIIPEITYHENESLFARLKHEPLTKLIFDNPETERVSFLNYPITPQTIEYHWLQPAMHEEKALLWARLSGFIVNESPPFYLFEILLPGLVSFV